MRSNHLSTTGQLGMTATGQIQLTYPSTSASRYARTCCARGCPHPQPRADSPDRVNPPGRHLGRERLGSLYPQRVRPGYGSGYVLRPGYAAIGLPGTADDRHAQLIGPDQGDRRSRRHGGAGRAVAEPVRHVGRQRRRDAQVGQPPRQRRNRRLAARRVGQHHRAGADRPVHRRRHQPAYPPRLPRAPAPGHRRARRTPPRRPPRRRPRPPPWTT